MNYPLISEYIEAINVAEDNFEELSYLRPLLSDDGNPVMSAGGFSVVFKMKDERDGKYYAVKCFTKDQEGRSDSYKLIADELEFVSSNYLTSIKFYEKELFVDTNNSDYEEFPVLLMDWVEGKTLDVYIRENINNQYALEMLAYQFNKLGAWLITQSFAHGDLKPDNIIIKEDGQLVLVDYDGIYVPSMKGQRAREMGSPGFRHPSRTIDLFDEHIDDFSIASIALSLKAIALKPSLYSEFGGNDKLLFSENDFLDLNKSKVILSLQSLMTDKELCTLYGIFMIAWAKNDLSLVSYRLLNIGKSQKDNLQDIISQYLEATECVKTGKYERAFHIFSSLVKNRRNKSNILGHNGLGYLYAYGLFVVKNEEMAVMHFIQASNYGWAMSQFNLGICFEKGIGVKKNQNEANRLFHLAALQNFGPAIDLESWETYTYLSAKEEAALNRERLQNLTSKFII